MEMIEPLFPWSLWKRALFLLLMLPLRLILLLRLLLLLLVLFLLKKSTEEETVLPRMLDEGGIGGGEREADRSMGL